MIYLPTPTEEECKFNKAHYFNRCYQYIWDNNLRTDEDYSTYVSIFYNAYLLEGKELTINEIKKRMKNG
jgi:hypothetical protein